MSFFDDTKNAGLALYIAAILSIIGAILLIVCAFVDDDMKEDDIGWAIQGVGDLICGFIMLGFGKMIKSGELSDKFDIVTRFVMVVAMVTIIGGIFTAISCIGFDDKGAVAGSGIISIIIGLIIYFIYTKITNDSVGTFDRIMWIILLVIFVIMIILNFLALFGAFGYDGALAIVVALISAICGIIIYIFMTIFMLDGDVKAKFGM